MNPRCSHGLEDRVNKAWLGSEALLLTRWIRQVNALADLTFHGPGEFELELILSGVQPKALIKVLYFHCLMRVKQ